MVPTSMKLAFSFACLFFIVIIDKTYQTSLFDYSITVIPGMQQSLSGFQKWFIVMSSDLIYHGFYYAPYIITYFMIEQRERTFYYIFNASVLDALGYILKLYSHQARPYWVSKDIQPLSCVVQYGNPSNHALASLGIALALWLDYNSVFR